MVKEISRKILSLSPFYILIFFTIGCVGVTSNLTRSGMSINPMGGRVSAASNGASATIDGKIFKKSYLDPLLSSSKQRTNSTNQRSGFPSRKRYLIEPKDVLKIEVRNEPDLSVVARVSEEGIIWVPLVENVKVTGLTIHEIEDLVEERLREGYLKNPKVLVMIDIARMLEYSEKEVFITGQVKTPGAIPLLGKYITVFEAITKVGGFTEIAAPNRTKVIRVEDGVKRIIKVNLKKIKKGDKSQDIILKQGDIVVVPEAFF